MLNTIYNITSANIKFLHQKCLLLLLLTVSLTALSKSRIYLVESIPLDTHYGQNQLQPTKANWLELIAQAKKTIDIGAFYFNSAPNSSMITITNALLQAAKRGVIIRILLDKQFAKQSANAIKPLLYKHNIQIHYVDIKSFSGGVMHAKYMLIDQHVSFVGSQNFDWKAISQNYEMGIVIDSSALGKTIEHIFTLDWQLNLKQARRKLTFTPINKQHPLHLQQLRIYAAFSPVKLIPRQLDWELPRLLTLIDDAKKTIDIQLYQYSDLTYHYKRWPLIDNALKRAANRGVQIHMIVSDVMQKSRALANLKKLAQQKNITIKMSHIPDYKGKKIKYGRVAHAKYMVIDHLISWIGTGNWSKSYFYNSRDMAIIISGSMIAKPLQQAFTYSWCSKYVANLS